MGASARLIGIVFYSVLAWAPANAFEVTDISAQSGAVAHGPLAARIGFADGELARPRVLARGRFEPIDLRIGYKDGLDNAFSARVPSTDAADAFLGEATGLAFGGQDITAALGMRDGDWAGGLELGGDGFAVRSLAHDGRIALDGGAGVRLGGETRLRAGVRTRLEAAETRARPELKLRTRRLFMDRDDLALELGVGTAREPSASIEYALPWMDGEVDLRARVHRAGELGVSWEVTW